MRLFIVLAALVITCTTTANALPCKLQMADITFELRASAGSPTVMTSFRYGSGNEKVTRYTLNYTDGSTILLEQQDCVDNNLRLSLLSLNEKPTLLELNRMAAVLSATSMWRSFFGGGNAAVLLQNELADPAFTTRFAKGGQFFYGIDERMYAHSVRSHASLGFALGNTATQYRSLLTLTLSVRGA